MVWNVARGRGNADIPAIRLITAHGCIDKTGIRPQPGCIVECFLLSSTPSALKFLRHSSYSLRPGGQRYHRIIEMASKTPASEAKPRLKEFVHPAASHAKEKYQKDSSQSLLGNPTI